MAVSTYAQIFLVVILMQIRAKLPFSERNMSSVSQHPIYFVPVLLFIFALAKATEGIVVLFLKLSDCIPYIYRQLKFILCLVEETASGKKLGEGHTHKELPL